VSRYVTTEAAVEARLNGGDSASTRVTFDRTSGSSLEQRVVRFAPGRSRPRGSGRREEVLFVVSGSGTLELGEEAHTLERETGAYVAPEESYMIENPGPEELVVVSVAGPETDGGATGRRRTVRLADQPRHPAGKDREFRYVVGEEAGCRTVTQFVGSIPPGRAKPHYHEYEEVAFILGGEGVLHIGGERRPVTAGSCIHFPRREPHILENVGDAPLRVLGVFHPAGDPSMAFNVPELDEREET
jgi:mannose-6-phosphate isomerase-like protein (cupin superfamily)